MNPDSQGLNRILQAADAWASSGHTGFQKHIGLFKVGLIGAEEAARRSFNDIKILAEAGDNTAKAVVRNVLYKIYGEDTYNEMAKINLAEKNQSSQEVLDPSKVVGGVEDTSRWDRQYAEEVKKLGNKIVTSKPVVGLRGNRMAMAALAGLGGAASGATLASLLNKGTNEDV